MTTPTSSQFTRPVLTPSAVSPGPLDEPLEAAAQMDQSCIIPSAREIDVAKMEQSGLIDQEGNFQKKGVVPFDLIDQEKIHRFMEVSHTFENCEWSWNLRAFFNYFVPYFINTFEGTTIELRQGVYQVVGQEYWQTQLKKWSPCEMWDFCKQPTRCYEFWVSLSGDITQDDLEKFHQLSIYLLAEQTMIQHPDSFQAALSELEVLRQETPPVGAVPLSRWQFLRKTMESIKTKVQIAHAPYSSIEIPLDALTSFKLIWTTKPSSIGLPFQLTLNWDQHEVFYTLRAHKNKPHAALSDLMIHRWDIGLSSDCQQLLSQYLVGLTLKGPFFQQKKLDQQLGKILEKCNSSIFAAAFEQGRKRFPMIGVAACYFNMFVYLRRQGIPLSDIPPLNLSQEEQGEMAKIPWGFSLQNIELLDALLQIITRLHAGLILPGLQLFISDSHMDICSSDVHFVFPYDLEKAEKTIEKAAEQDVEDLIATLTQTLKAFFPTIDDIKSTSKKFDIPILGVLYRLVRTTSQYQSTLHLASFLQGKGDVKDVMCLPSLWAYAEKTGKLEIVGDILSKFYELSPYASLFSKIKEDVLQTTKNSYLAALKPLLVSHDPKIYPPAWALCSSPTVDTLIEIAPDLTVETFPLALKHLTSHTRLLQVYFDLLIKFCDTPAIFHAYGPQLVRLLAEHGNHLSRPFKVRFLQFLTERRDLFFYEVYHFAASFNFTLEEVPHLISYMEGGIESSMQDGSEILESIRPFLKDFQRPLLMNFLRFLIDQKHPFTREMHALIERVQPTSEEAPHLLDHLLTQLEGEVDLPFIGRLQNLISRFAEKQDDRILPYVAKLVNFLIEHPEDEVAWKGFLKIVDSLKKTAWFIESYVSILERISSMKNPPLACFQKKINPEGLTPSQKKRLAKSYAIVIPEALKKRQENNLIQALPSLEWLMTELKIPDLVPHFVDLFVSLQPRHSMDSNDALWIAQQTTHHCPSTAAFIRWLVAQNSQKFNSLEWKKTVLGLISICVSQAGDVEKLFKFFRELITVEEQAFYEECMRLWKASSFEILQPLLKSYPKNEALSPAEIRDQAISQLMSLNEEDTLEEALALLERMPDDNADQLWILFFRTFKIFCKSPSSDPDFCRRVWGLWLQRNPLNIRDEMCWFGAISACLTHTEIMRDQIHSFLQQQFPTLIWGFSREKCIDITRIVLQIATDIDSNEISLLALSQLLSNPALEQKIGDPWALLKVEEEMNLALVLASQPDVTVHKTGHEQFLLAMVASECQKGDSLLFFQSYSSKPYRPLDGAAQAPLYAWIQDNWKLHHASLDWIQACFLIQKLCQFDVDPLEVYGMWEMLTITKFKEVAAELIPSKIPLFWHTTATVVDLLVDHQQAYPKGLEKLPVLHQKFYHYCTTHAAQDLIYLKQVPIYFASTIFIKLLSISPQILKLGLENLEQSWEYTRKNGITEYKPVIVSFLAKLPDILKDPSLMELVKRNIEKMMTLPLIMRAPLNEGHSWAAVLQSLCWSVQCYPLSAPLQQFVKNTFLKYTQNKNSIHTLAHYFLVLPLQFLAPTDFRDLIQGLSAADIQEMLRSLLLSPQSDPNKRCLLSLAAARLMRYAKQENLSFCLTYAESEVPAFDSSQPIYPQLLMRTEWIVALSTLLSHPSKKRQALQGRKVALTQELTPLILSQITDEETYQSYSILIMSIIGDDKEVVIALNGAFHISNKLPPDIQQKLKQLKRFIEFKLN